MYITRWIIPRILRTSDASLRSLAEIIDHMSHIWDLG